MMSAALPCRSRRVGGCEGGCGGRADLFCASVRAMPASAMPRAGDPDATLIAIHLHNRIIDLCPPRDSNSYAFRPRILSPLRLPFRQAGVGGRYSRRSSGRNPLGLSMLAETASTRRARPTQTGGASWARWPGHPPYGSARGRSGSSRQASAGWHSTARTITSTCLCVSAEARRCVAGQQPEKRFLPPGPQNGVCRGPSARRL